MKNKIALITEPTEASAYHYRVTFKPQLIIPDMDLRVDLSDLPRK